jgi:hypothetical protein
VSTTFVELPRVNTRSAQRWIWLRSAAFDNTLILGITLVALLTGVVVHLRPSLFTPILLLDILLLGYHHVGATFTRLIFDSESLSRHRGLITWLPLLVALAVLFSVRTVGLWPTTTLYFYWQWFHYSRQSYGIAQAFRRKSPEFLPDSPLLHQLTFYAIPLWGILSRSAGHPNEFLGSALRALPVPAAIAQSAGILAVAAALAWGLRVFHYARRSAIPMPYVLYMLCHFAMFFTAYIGMRNLNHGWLVINIWHNAQYILFVWLFNTNRFRNGVDPRHWFLSTISQRKNVLFYFGVCIACSTLFYALVQQFLSITVVAALLPSMAVAYQMINFHHYIVDGIIWKRPAARPIATANV